MEVAGAGRRRCFCDLNLAMCRGSLPGAAAEVAGMVFIMELTGREEPVVRAPPPSMPPVIPDRMVNPGSMSMAKALPPVEAVATVALVASKASEANLGQAEADMSSTRAT